MRSLLAGLTLVLAYAGDASCAEQQPPKPGRSVAIEVVLADAVGPNASQTAGSTDMTSDRIQELERQGKLEATGLIRFQTIEQCAAMVQFGERVPVATGRTMMGGMGGAREGRPMAVNYTMENIGTMLEVTPQVCDDGSILLDLKLERSRLINSPAPVGDTDVTPPRTTTITAKTVIRIPPGKTIVAQAQQASGQESRLTWVLVSAQVVTAK